jgi:hypothetical protein
MTVEGGWIRIACAKTLFDETGAVHFSFSYTTSLEVSTASWHLEDIPVALTSADKTWIQQQIATVTAFDKPQEDGTPTSKIGRLALTQGIPNGTREGAPRDQAWQVIADLGKALVVLQSDVDELSAKVDELSAKLGDPAAAVSVPQPR